MSTIGGKAAPGRSSGAVLIGTAAARVAAADRRSRVFPGGGERLLHVDLHNHTLLSDGDGRPEDAFASMRAAGLDVAAITDHASVDPLSPNSIDADAWRQLAELADEADEAGAFVALRGFEWSSPSLGHMSVWGSAGWTNPIAATGVEPGDSPGNLAVMAAFHEWLRSDPGPDGGRDALVGFNHPGRETGRFGGFVHDAGIAERVVSLEMFNRGEDYLFEQVDRGRLSPLVECLDAGWRVGLLGVTDEHGTDWGFPTGLGRGGLWTYGATRSDIRAAMGRRRFFATRERNLRLDASARSGGGTGPAGDDGVPMGARLLHDRGDIVLTVDVDGGPEWTGRPLRVQVLQTGRPLPTVVDEFDLVVPADGPTTATTSVDRADGEWIVLRLTDPALPADRRAAAFPSYASAGHTVAYASPFFLGPGTARPAPGDLGTTALDGATFGLRAGAHDHPA